jgi:hypothetical protein
MANRSRMRCLIAAAAPLLLLSGCGSGVAPTRTVTLLITPDTSTMVVGTSVSFSVTESGGSSGVPKTGPIPSWSVDNPTVAAVTLDGQLTATRTGTVTLTVSFLGAGARRVITVTE